MSEEGGIKIPIITSLKVFVLLFLAFIMVSWLTPILNLDFTNQILFFVFVVFLVFWKYRQELLENA
jgi:Flp pilus assembly protein TadB